MNPEDARSVEELRSIVENGAAPKYVLFWGHTPKVPGEVDQSCLSNWFPASFEVGDVTYPTTEHYMMAEKAVLFDDPGMRDQIIKATTPGEAKKLGRKVANFDDDVWKKHRFEIVVAGNLAKFEQNEEMRGLLLRTGSKVLVEASPRDRIWGIGMGKNNPAAEDPQNWRGRNLLGFALMEVRERLANASNS